MIRSKKAMVLTALGFCMLGQGGCASYGPKSLNKDQLDYGRSVGETWKNQMLANLVKLRYLDMPVFVDVGQIVSGYTVETKVRGDIGFGTSLSGGDSQALGVEGKFTDRPTITYTPKTGEAYLHSLLEPVEPRALLSLVLADYNARLLFLWAVQSINGLQNYSARERAVHAADPGFLEFVQLLGELQRAGLIGFRLEVSPETGHDIIFFYRQSSLDDALRRKMRRSRDLIGLDPDRQSFHVVFAPMAIEDDVLAIQTRSVLQMLIAMSKFIDVPGDKAARAIPGISLTGDEAPPFRVRTSPEEPPDAFARFRYHGDWYWIDHEDLVSKRVFLLMLFLTTLTNRASDERAPVLTIPTN